MARTIDNLGVDISTRYAEDREVFDDSILKEARLIPAHTSVATTLPTYSEFDILFELGKRGSVWALFQAPFQYYASKRRLFAEQVIPGLGPPDKQEAQRERIEALGDDERKKKREQDPELAEEVEKEKKILVKLFENIHDFDQQIIDINSRRAQYQKG